LRGLAALRLLSLRWRHAPLQSLARLGMGLAPLQLSPSLLTRKRTAPGSRTPRSLSPGVCNKTRRSAAGNARHHPSPSLFPYVIANTEYTPVTSGCQAFFYVRHHCSLRPFLLPRDDRARHNRDDGGSPSGIGNVAYFPNRCTYVEAGSWRIPGTMSFDRMNRGWV
jgi:hypothetical protein